MSAIGETDNPLITYEQQLSSAGVIVSPNVGSSMRPLIRQGKDLMVIRPRPEKLRRYDAVLYKRGSKYILHRILRVGKDGYVICGDNCLRREFDITDDKIIGILTAVLRNGKKEIRTDGFRCRLYAHIWCDFFPVRVAILYTGRLFRAFLRKIGVKKVKKDPEND